MSEITKKELLRIFSSDIIVEIVKFFEIRNRSLSVILRKDVMSKITKYLPFRTVNELRGDVFVGFRALICVSSVTKKHGATIWQSFKQDRTGIVWLCHVNGEGWAIHPKSYYEEGD